MDTLNQMILDSLGSIGWTAEAALRLCLAAALGGVIGLEREMRGREAGFRTNILVCLGSALVMLVSMQLADIRWVPLDSYNIQVDPGRIAYGVMTGIGFLGAGAILKHEGSVRGLTTAAGLWCVAALGLAIGMGLYLLSLIAALLVILALWLLQHVEGIVPARRFRRLVVRCAWSRPRLAALLKRFQEAGIDVFDQSYQRIGDLSEVDVSLSISFTKPERFDALEAQLQADPDYQLICSERL